MPIRQHHIALAPTLLLCLAVGGCGGSNSTTSSTNDTQPPPTGNDNRPPTAQISGSHVTLSGETVTLDGSASSDPDGDSLVFHWSQTAGPALGLGGTSNSSLSFVAPTVSQPTQYSIRLLVDDGELSDSSDFNLQVSPLSDDVSPSVTLRSPAPDETGVAVTTRITVSFDEALLSTSIDASSLTLGLGSEVIPGSVSYDDSLHSISFTPSAPLMEASSYLVTLGDDTTDLAGNPVTAESWGFTTTADYNLGATTQQTIDRCMDDNDKEMLTLVNNTRAAARDCGGTHFAAAAALAWHCQLENAAQVHSDAMASNDFFDHTGLDGSSPGERITAAGYAWYTYGENIAAGYEDAQAAMDAWIASPGHCANLMNPNFMEMGAAMGSDPESTYGIYWTQDFAAR
ncbi:MAG: CAP domain-containing protein [Candidatus Thiodiazotropha sp.]